MAKQLKIKRANLERSFNKSLASLPDNIVRKVNEIIEMIRSGAASYRDFQGKRMVFNRDVISLRVGSKHRLLLANTPEGLVPWQCLSHETYSKLYMRISSNCKMT